MAAIVKPKTTAKKMKNKITYKNGTLIQIRYTGQYNLSPQTFLWISEDLILFEGRLYKCVIRDWHNCSGWEALTNPARHQTLSVPEVTFIEKNSGVKLIREEGNYVALHWHFAYDN